jgi:hypothetical protein
MMDERRWRLSGMVSRAVWGTGWRCGESSGMVVDDVCGAAAGVD